MRHELAILARERTTGLDSRTGSFATRLHLLERAIDDVKVNVVNRNRVMQPALFGALVLAGIATTMVGPLLPRLESRWHIGDAEAGLLFTGLFLASVMTGALVGPLASRFGHVSVIRGGLVFTSLGVTLLAVSPWPQAIGAIAIVGCGLGLCIPAANLAATGARAVMLVNFAWSIGAVGGPLFLASFPRAFLWTLSAALACATVGYLGAPTRVTGAVGIRTVISKATVLTGIFLFLYVGAESSLDGWLSSYASRNPAALGLWAALPSVFWGGILTGRLVATFAVQRFTPGGLIIACLSAAFSGACLLLAAPYGWAIVVAAALTGFSMAPIFPLAVAKYTESTKGEKAAGLIFSAGGLGGASVPALVGSVSQFSGSLRFAMAIAPVLLVAMLLLWTICGLGQGRD
jgi:FHS family glucose/mannose:H+ symporter-like MFS transporter